MKSRRRFAPVLLLALALLLALPAGAAGSTPVVRCYAAGDAAVLTVEGIDSRVYAAQAELTLEGEYPQASVSVGNSAAYVPAVPPRVENGRTIVTVILASQDGNPISSGATLELGALRVNAGGGAVMPSSAVLTLANQSLEAFQSADSASVPVLTGQGSGGAAAPSPAPSPNVYPIQITQGIGGTVQTSALSAAQGSTVTLTITPDAGQKLDTLAVTDAQGKPLSLITLGNGRYSFIMPDGPVSVRAAFAADGEEGEESQPLPFTDVSENDWFYQELVYVYQNGLMNGTDGGKFSPNMTTSRGMIVTVLYRMEGQPAAGQSGFADVRDDMYYAAPVAWAAANGIVNGYDSGLFGPEDPITREQMAAILYRYAAYKGRDVSARADLSGYPDAGRISDYAVESLRWANAVKLVNGTDAGTLSPTGQASRAQIAAVLARFCNNVL